MDQRWGEIEFGFGLDYLLDNYVEMSNIQGFLFCFFPPKKS